MPFCMTFAPLVDPVVSCYHASNMRRTCMRHGHLCGRQYGQPSPSGPGHQWSRQARGRGRRRGRVWGMGARMWSWIRRLMLRVSVCVTPLSHALTGQADCRSATQVGQTVTQCDKVPQKFGHRSSLVLIVLPPLMSHAP